MSDLEPIQARLKQIEGIKKAVEKNHREVGMRSRGIAKLAPLEMYQFATTRLAKIDLSDINLVHEVIPKGQVKAEEYPYARGLVDEVNGVYRQIDQSIVEINRFAEHATVTSLFNTFTENPSEKEKLAYGEELLKHFA